MGAQVRIERGPDERLLAVKAARPGGEPALAREAALLRTIRMPGVVEVVDEGTEPGDRPAPAVLVTRWVGPRTAADLERPVPPDRAAGLCLALAGTVARLHRAGVVHGAIEASHVVLDAEGRPVLCGFGSAGPIDVARRPADDVAGLGELLRDLLTSGDGPSDDRLTVRRADRSRHRALLAVASQATSDDPAGRPSVAAFVHGVRRAVPEASLDPTSPTRPGRRARTAVRDRGGRDDDGRAEAAGRAPRDRPGSPVAARPDPGSRSTRSRAQAALGVAAVVVAGATAYFGLSAWGSPAVTPAPELADSPIATTTPRSTGSTDPPPTTTRPATTTSPGPAASAAGGPPVVEHLGRRYEVGEPGDVAAVGPWLCDGNDVVALLRPTTGTVHVFTTWASDEATVAARNVASVPGASSLERVADGPGCAVLVVSSAAGPLRTLTSEDLR